MTMGDTLAYIAAKNKYLPMVEAFWKLAIKQDTTMKELIEEAEKLYKQIDKAQVHLINARLSNDEEGKKSAISEMETAMCDVSRLLKCFIERKDNIVDLSEA